MLLQSGSQRSSEAAVQIPRGRYNCQHLANLKGKYPGKLGGERLRGGTLRPIVGCGLGGSHQTKRNMKREPATARGSSVARFIDENKDLSELSRSHFPRLIERPAVESETLASGYHTPKMG